MISTPACLSMSEVNSFPLSISIDEKFARQRISEISALARFPKIRPTAWSPFRFLNASSDKSILAASASMKARTSGITLFPTS